MSVVICTSFVDYTDSVAAALNALFDAHPEDTLPNSGLIILKPNLTTDSPPPVTTPVEFTEAVYRWIRSRSSAEIAIGEGCGSGKTERVFRSLGYEEFADKEGIELIDFNLAETVEQRNPEAYVLKEFQMPKILQEAYLVSLPILKDHSFTETTIAMKNIFGCAPGSVYGGSWNKSKLHSPSTDLNVVDICRYLRPDLSIVDAVTALTGMHLSGTPKRLDTILAGFDPVAVDAVGSRMLGHDPERLEYLEKAEGIIGTQKGIKAIKV